MRNLGLVAAQRYGGITGDYRGKESSVPGRREGVARPHRHDAADRAVDAAWPAVRRSEFEFVARETQHAGDVGYPTGNSTRPDCTARSAIASSWGRTVRARLDVIEAKEEGGVTLAAAWQEIETVAATWRAPTGDFLPRKTAPAGLDPSTLRQRFCHHLGRRELPTDVFLKAGLIAARALCSGAQRNTAAASPISTRSNGPRSNRKASWRNLDVTFASRPTRSSRRARRFSNACGSTASAGEAGHAASSRSASGTRRMARAGHASSPRWVHARSFQRRAW